MTDTINATKPAAGRKSQADLMKDWELGADGKSLSRTFVVATPKEAARLAGRVVSFGFKREVPVELHYSGSNVVVTMRTAGLQGNLKGLVDRKQLGMMRRLDRMQTGPAEKKPDQG